MSKIKLMKDNKRVAPNPYQAVEGALKTHTQMMYDQISGNPSDYAKFINELQEYFKHHYHVQIDKKLEGSNTYYFKVKAIFEEYFEHFKDVYSNHFIHHIEKNAKNKTEKEKMRQSYLHLTNSIEKSDNVLKAVKSSDFLFTCNFDDMDVKKIYSDFKGFEQYLRVVKEMYYMILMKEKQRNYAQDENVEYRAISKKYIWHLATIYKIITEG